MGAHRYTVRMTESELRAVYLFSMLRRPGTGLRRFLAVAVGAVALAVGFEQEGASARVFGIVIALGCAWTALRPFILSRVMSKNGSPEVEVEFDQKGVSVTRAGKTAQFAWSSITAQGHGPGFYWYEIRSGALAAIPDRLVKDPAGLEKLLARAGQKD